MTINELKAICSIEIAAAEPFLDLLEKKPETFWNDEYTLRMKARSEFAQELLTLIEESDAIDEDS